MPLNQLITPSRVAFFGAVTARQLRGLIDNRKVRVLQTETRLGVKPATWDLLNGQLFSVRPDITLRVWGFEPADLSFLRRMGNVRRFSADCLRNAKGLEHLAGLKRLEELTVDVFELQSFDFLDDLPLGLRELGLGATRSRKPSLHHLQRFRRLRELYIEGHHGQIEVIGSLSRLEKLTLRSITVDSLAFVRMLPKLWSLDLKLGGTSDLSALKGLHGLKYLELWRIAGLKDISVISTLHGLQFLFLEALRHIRTLPSLAKLNRLRRLSLQTMNGLKDVKAALKAPALEEFIHSDVKTLEPEAYKDLLRSTTLKRVFVSFGSRAKNERFRELARQAGMDEYESTNFRFQ